MKNTRYQSWGRYPKVEQDASRLEWRSDALPLAEFAENNFLPFGNGRSYGDVCLNADGALLDCRGLDRFIDFNKETGVLRCESGVLLSEVLELCVPQGWFLPATPGTQYVTLGGAIANDVHGKNHHKEGTFGRHVRCFELLRSDESRIICSPSENEDYFKATIGGLGLTGVITWVEIQLQAVKSALVDQETIRYSNLDEFFTLAGESDNEYEYTVAWLDCLAKGKNLGRGLFTRGNHADTPMSAAPQAAKGGHLSFPVDPPISLVNGLSVKAFNAAYYRKQRAARVSEQVHYRPFFYPLDAIQNWNRMYGSKGFLQYQCVVPVEQMKEAVREILERIGQAGLGSFLVVLKLFGDKQSPGLLSFPMPGATLALDFPNQGSKTFSLLDQLDQVTHSAGGRVYPCKDARMRPEDFQKAYPSWRTIEQYRDPNISSSFWRRVTAAT